MLIKLDSSFYKLIYKLISAFLLLGFLVFLYTFLFNNYTFAQDSPDAIAIRVISNADNVSPTRWYREQGFKGSPQSLTVDGYEAIRDGRTVYVNAANISGGTLYTNIYLISYNQEAEKATTDIFGRILSHWKFNIDKTTTGYCFNRNIESDCSGTVGCWSFENNYDDDSGNNNNGTFSVAATFENGIIGESLSFDNISSISFGTSNDYSVQNISILYWVKPTAQGLTYWHWNNAGGSGTNIGTLMTPGNIARFQVTAGGVAQSVYSSQSLDINKWNFVAATYDGTEMKIYVNGSADSVNHSIAGDITWSGDPNPSWSFGGGGGGVPFVGELDEAKIYNHALTAEEIVDQYRTTLKNCLTDSDCQGNGYCSSLKARVTRDTIRLADLSDIELYLEDYRLTNGGYPSVAAGTYLSNRTISTWPSWQATLSKDLKNTLPVDPINNLGSCLGYNPVTCWNETDKEFKGSLPYDMPLGSFAYAYRAIGSSTEAYEYDLCAVLESGPGISSGKGCGTSVLINADPVIINVNPLVVKNNTATAVAYVTAYDPDGDLLTWSVDGGASIRNTSENNRKEIFMSNTGGVGTRNLTVIVTDGPRGGSTSQSFDVIVDSCSDGDSDGYGDPASLACDFPLVDCDDGVNYIFPGAEESCDNNDNDCDFIKDEGCDDDGDGYCDSSKRLYNITPGVAPIVCINSSLSVTEGNWGDDCNDNKITVNPNTTEVCDGQDNNCNGVVDEGCNLDGDDFCDCNMEFTYGQDLSYICPGTNTTSDYWWYLTCDCDETVYNEGPYPSCIRTYCGDNVTQSDPPNDDYVIEQCDLGDNTIIGDNCDSNCQTGEDPIVPTCSDNKQNQDETGVDCGGIICPACATCSDGAQNQGETGIDCGGPCPACATCSDGAQNQGETGIDCGGPCSACGAPVCTFPITFPCTFP